MIRPFALAVLLVACQTAKPLIDTGTAFEEDAVLDLDADADGYTLDDDCDDNSADVHPEANETCDGVDNDCDGEIDEGVTQTWYADADGDGHGDADAPSEACEQPSGSVDSATDCDDNDPDIHPDASERCDKIDNDCDGQIDEDVTEVWYADADGDGFGDPKMSVEDCDPDDGYVSDNTDCDDTTNDAWPGAEEVCDGVDNDCDGDVDEEVTQTWYADADGDLWGDADSTTEACTQPDGYSGTEGDCDDSDAGINPSATELCNGQDDDCDGDTDENDAADTSTFYADTDADGFGDGDSSTEACEAPSGFVSDDTDCDDSDDTIHPEATEFCDGEDNDCDGETDEDDAEDASTWYLDLDGDGYGTDDYTASACDAPSGFSERGGDCDDDEADNNPDATETCDGEDNDCDGTSDEDDAGDALTFYADADGDGFGDATQTTTACDLPSGYSEDDTDCDDGESDVNPDATETCGNGVDEDCSGTADDDDEQWWDDGWPYRVPFEVDAPAWDLDGPPVALSVDFAEALSDLGESGDFEADSLRVVLQDCALGLPELPGQFLDDIDGLFEKADHADPEDDGNGTVVFLYDEDGDTTSLERLEAGDTFAVGLYFDTSGTDPAYATGLLADTDQLANDLTDAAFDDTEGGLLDTLSFEGSASLMSQTDSCCGNGAYTTSWYETPMYTSADITLLHQGPVLAMIESTGNIGDYDFTYTYWMFDGRPELWSKTTHTTTDDVIFYHPTDFTSGIRPWESRQDNLTASGTFETDEYGEWADVSDGTVGISFGYRQPPDDVVGISNYDPYLIIVGSDYAPYGSGTYYTVPAGVSFIDEVVMFVLPHNGDFADVEDTLYGLMDGMESDQDSVESL